MAITKLKFDSPNKNIDEVSNNTNLRVIYDGYRDMSLSFKVRPESNLFEMAKNYS